MTLYRAATTTPTGKAGECWTDDRNAAEAYLHSGAKLYTADADVSDSTEVEIVSQADWDRLDTTEGRAAVAGDSAWIDYYDQDEGGHESRTYRTVTDVALTVTEVELDDDEDDGLDWLR